MTDKERIINALTKGEKNWSSLWIETGLGIGALKRAIKELLDEKKVETVQVDYEAWLRLPEPPK